MKTPKYILMGSLAILVAATTSVAADKSTEKKPPAKATPEMSPEMRQRMATMHEKMAACLRSDKPMSECKGEMMRQCKEMMGKSGCPMMDHMGEGMMMDH